MTEKKDQRHLHQRENVQIAACRGGIKMIFKGKNSRGTKVTTTVFIDNVFISGIVTGIVTISKQRAEEHLRLINKIREAL